MFHSLRYLLGLAPHHQEVNTESQTEEQEYDPVYWHSKMWLDILSELGALPYKSRWPRLKTEHILTPPSLRLPK